MERINIFYLSIFTQNNSKKVLTFQVQYATIKE